MYIVQINAEANHMFMSLNTTEKYFKYNFPITLLTEILALNDATVPYSTSEAKFSL